MTHLITKRPDKHVIPSENLPNCEKRDPSMQEYVWVWSPHLGGYVGYVREDVYVDAMVETQDPDTRNEDHYDDEMPCVSLTEKDPIEESLKIAVEQYKKNVGLMAMLYVRRSLKRFS